MAKGWSLGGLVAALKSAAFRAVGVNNGDVIESGGPLGIGTNSIQTSFNFNWQTFEFRAGQMLFVDIATSLNLPPINWLPAGTVQVTVVGRGDFTDRVTLLCTQYGGAIGNPSTVQVSFTGNAGSRVFKVRTIMTAAPDLGTQNISLLGTATSIGIYAQPLDANALTSLGYPIQQAGVLTILPSAYAVMQIYQTYQGKMFQRNVLSGQWTLWTEFVSTQGRQDSMFGSVELYAGNPYLDFHYNNTQSDFDVRLINNQQNQLELSTPGTGRLYISNGNVTVRARPQAWGDTFNVGSNSPLRLTDVTVPGDSWIPFASCKAAQSNVGYATTVSFGMHLLNTTNFSNPVIQAWNDNGTYGQWELLNQSGDIYYNNKNGSRQVLFTDTAGATYATKTELNNNVANLNAGINTKASYTDLANSQNALNARIDGAVTGVRQVGIANVQIVQYNSPFYVPGGCSIMGYQTDNGDTLQDYFFYTQLQVYLPTMGWVNVGRA